ncbi:MAG: aspartate/glutamate racemase family protein [Roseovarius sp.]
MTYATSRGRARIGVMVPFTNTNLEPDLIMMCPPGVSVHITRLGGYDEDEIPDEDQMAGLGASDMGGTLSLLQGVKPDVIQYGCTSATLAHGPSFDSALAQQIKAQAGAQTVTAAGAVVHALKSLGAHNVAFASPYVPSLNDRAIAYLADEGITAVSRADVTERLGNAGQGAMTPEAVKTLARRADCDQAQAIVLSCTDMRSTEVIAQIEAELGKPVVTSNQAMMFQTLQCLGITDVPAGFGQLMERLHI